MRKKRDTPSNPLFKELKLLKINEIIKLNTAVFVFKVLNNLTASSIQFQARLNGPYNLRNTPPLDVPFARHTQSQMFISIRGAVLWNSLPSNIRSARTLFSFKKHVKTYYLTSYDNL